MKMTKIRQLYGFMLLTWLLVCLDAVCIHSWAREHVRENVEKIEKQHQATIDIVYILSQNIKNHTHPETNRDETKEPKWNLL